MTFPAASFSLVPTATVLEGSSVMICTTMTASAENTLEREVVVILSTQNGTGILLVTFGTLYLESKNPRCQKSMFYTATAGDFAPISEVSLTFSPGSGNGAEVCISVTTNADDAVENEEDFTVTLGISNSGSSFTLGNAATTITIIDADGMKSLRFSV
jgi:hypothetical protein